jgi:hypothetical protein
LDQVFHRAALLRESSEVAHVRLAGREVLRQVRRPTLLCPATTIFGFSAATVSMLAVQASRFASSASHIIMCTLL